LHYHFWQSANEQKSSRILLKQKGQGICENSGCLDSKERRCPLRPRKRRKVSIVGAGNVGATTAQKIVENGLADVVILDVREGMAQGKALDILESGPLLGFDTRIVGSGNYETIEGSSVVVVTAGFSRKPGMTREDLLHKNGDIMIEVAGKIRKHAPESVVIMVTNPMDLMAYMLWKVTGFPRERVIGMGGALDSSRFAYFVSEVTNTSVSNIQTMVMGGHGDDMVPLLEFSTIAGVSLKKVLDPAVLQGLVDRTRDGGGEIVRLMKDSSAYFAPAAAIYSMIESILHDRHRVIPSSVYLEGEYGVKGVFSGVPVQIGNIGLEKIVLLPLSTEEEEAFHRSTESIRQGISTIERLFPDLGRS
jgi:malate dehydrogenase